MFEKALDIILSLEGGFANDPKDPGGATNFGITQATYNAYNSHIGVPQQSVRLITHKEVAAIYFKNYWVDGACDKIELLDPFLAAVHFDDCVNTGISQAARNLQRCLGVNPDGEIGPATLAAISKSVALDKNALRVSYLARRIDFYLDLVLGRSILRSFLPSWMRRIQKLMERMVDYA